jgi:hypothetical protein
MPRRGAALRLALLAACCAARGAMGYAPHPPKPPPPPPKAPKMFATAIRCALSHALLPACALFRWQRTCLTRAHARTHTRPARLACAHCSGEGGPPIQDTPVGTAGTTTFTLQWLTDIDPLAVCNDGSPAAYYYAPGSGSSGACVCCAGTGGLGTASPR